MQAGLSLKPVNLPSQDLAFTNLVYLSQQDAFALCGTDKGPIYADIKGCIFSLQSDARMQPATIALNKVQREWAKIGLNQEVFVTAFRPRPDANLGSCSIEVDHLAKPTNETKLLEAKSDDLEKVFRDRFDKQCLSTAQPIAIDYGSVILKFSVLSLQGIDVGDGKTAQKLAHGVIGSQTEIEFRQGTSGKLHVLSDKVQQRGIFRPDFNFEELGIGGLSKEFGDIFRRAFAARVFPPHVVRDLGITYIRGMLLYGPPGTGKTLIARQLAKFLKAAEPKIINGPEILNKYVGQSEENIRKLFEDAEKEYKQQGENSQLHIIIFDEIDAICKSRGSARDGTGVGDSVVNQLLSKIDGVDALNNILLIGMTNRIDMIDEALLRPGRLEVHVEISLPSESGRVEILNIHTKNMREKKYLDQSVTVEAVAARTKNFSGAELEGLVRSATSFALNRKVNVHDISKPKELSNISVTHEDFEHALTEVKPAFGQHDDDFQHCMRRGIIPYSSEFEHMLSTSMSLIEQVRSSENTPLLSVLLHGPPSCGKTALAAHLAAKCDYPFVRRVASENYVGYSEQAKVSAITKMFDDAYKSSLSLLVLDDLERLMDYVRIGPRFSNVVLQGIFSLLKKQPPKEGRRLLIIGTTSDLNFLEESELARVFNVQVSVPVVSSPDSFKTVLSMLPGFQTETVSAICAAVAGKHIGIQKLLLVAEMAVQRQNPVSKDVFFECLEHAGCVV
eukprot:gnl/TRDRNA2_/TRDRNA2_36142_c0_seq1.p1 gnl/TRDRNA2_/TRDRNA2_36142_c0~~gnl/TRDRNA2_/TRDRNA2_36142_c0_seq1.p1  ORF type:complete len:732 (+),score=170.63 gnl/TRDRNA2_/TRDRNA2_36142_c0_seq1:79-2274(+)